MCMKRLGQAAACCILIFVLIWFLADSQDVRAAASAALQLCGRSVIPSLFPFLAVSSLLISLGFGTWLAPSLSGLMASLFGLPGQAGSALVLGLVGGYPIGAQTAADLFRAGHLTRQEAERLLTFCNNSNPVFLISVLGCGVFGSLRSGVFLWLIHLLSALLTGILFCGRRGRRAASRACPPPQLQKVPSLPGAFVAAVRSSAAGMVTVCAFVILFYTLASPLAALDTWWSAGAVGFLELFSLTPLLTPDPAGFVLAALCAGWGGLSVLCQTAAMLEGSGLSILPCVLGKAVQGLLSAALAALAAGLLL